MSKTKKEESIVEESNNKSIIITLVAIFVVLGLILGYTIATNNKEKLEPGEEDVEIIDDGPTEYLEEVSLEETPVVKKVTSTIASAIETYDVVYLDHDLNQIGETQKVTKAEERVDEQAPKLSGHRFSKWAEVYDENTKTYYYVAVYVKNVERIPAAEEPYLNERKAETEETYTVEIEEVVPEENNDKEENLEDPIETEENINSEEEMGPTYDVTISGEIEYLEEDDVEEEVTIDTEEFSHIIALKFNAPENVTKENIDNMWIKLNPTHKEETIEEDQYSYKGEDELLSGKELLDSSEEEYENDNFYFYYYQEADTQTEVTIEVYWGNDPEENEEACPPVGPSSEYIETYNIKFEEVELETPETEEAL